MNEEVESNQEVDKQIDSALEKLSEEGLFEENESNTELLSGEEDKEDGAEGQPDVKTSDEDGGEEVTPLDAPASWRSDEKELFKTLPREQQETALRIQQAQDSHFTQRSTELAQKIRATDDARHNFESTRAQFSDELMRLNQLANQLLPAKFSDIQSHSDYLRLKTTDPARASEYEAFQQILHGSMKQAQALNKAKEAERLNSEWNTFVSKYPEYQDGTKAKEMLTGVRKGAVDYYGFTPQEMTVIPDHRYIPVIKDALAWRQYQSDLRIAQTKKIAPVAKKVIKSGANNGETVQGDMKNALLTRANRATNDRQKAEFIAQMLMA